jgi:hypothetical protein
MNTRYIIIKEKKLILCDMTKVASQSIRKLTLDYYNSNESIWSDNFAKQYWRSDISHLIDYQLVSLVRNPYSRLVSGFYDKFIKNQNLDQVLNIFKYYNRDIEEGISFNEFCIYLEDRFNELGNDCFNEFDIHWYPQNLIIGDIEKAIIIKIEDPNKDQIFKQITGLNLPYYHSGEKKGDSFCNVVSLNTDCSNYRISDFSQLLINNEMPNPTSFYNDINKSIINNIYKKDFDLLQYDNV